MGHGLSIRKLQDGDIGLCHGSCLTVPLFRSANIGAMREILRQLSLQAEQLENESQWTGDTAA